MSSPSQPDAGEDVPTSPSDPTRLDELPGFSEHLVDCDDGAIVYAQVCGPAAGRAVLILDGIGCSGWAFRRIIPALAVHHRVVLVQYRGHGRSPNPPRPWRVGIEDLADDAATVLRVLEIGPVLAVGFSMGFQVALELYKRHREHVVGLVSLAGPSGRVLAEFGGSEVFGHLFPFVQATTRAARDTTLALWRAVLPSKAMRVLGISTQVNADRIPAEDFEFYLLQMAAMSPELFIEMLHEASRHCTDDLLPRVRVPTLVVAGGLDRFVPLATMRRVAFAIPGATWVVIPDASHALPAEFPAEITDQLLGFSAVVLGEVAPP